MEKWYKSRYQIHELQRALYTIEARNLLLGLPRPIREKCVRCYFYEDREALDDVIRFFVENSDIARLAKGNPGMAEIFEYFYRKKNVHRPIDQYFIKSNVGRSMHKRLIALRENLPRIIHRELTKRNGNTLVIDNIGSGPGHDIIDVLVEHPELAPSVHVRNIDPDSAALEIGKKRVESLGLSDSFSFLNMKFEEVTDFHGHIILLIGIFCPMKRRLCEFILRRLKTLYRPGTVIVFSTVQKRMEYGDPLMRFIMELMGWPMDYKTDKETEAIAKAAGWQPIEQFFDEPLRYNCIQVARST